MADLKGLSRIFIADEEMAQREHEKLLNGEPINAIAVNNAMQAVQQGINPDTQQPLQSPDEAEQILNNAALKPLDFENFDTHLEQHSLFMKSPEFTSLPLPVQQAFTTHWELTLQAALSIPPRPEPIAPRVALQLKGTVGPTGAAEILNKAGVVNITPDTMTEPPLETWVSDSMDKPDEDSTGNDPLTDQDMMQRAQDMRHETELQQGKIAAQAANVQTAQAKTDTARLQALSHAQKLSQQQEQHQQR